MTKFYIKTVIIGAFLVLTGIGATAQNTEEEQQMIELSQKKWDWMADKNADKLEDLFHEKSQFVHMGGSWRKDREVSIIRSGGIHYKKADIHEVSADIIGNTAIVSSRITLLAVVGGNEVSNPFIATEVYVKEDEDWKLARSEEHTSELQSQD